MLVFVFVRGCSLIVTSSRQASSNNGIDAQIHVSINAYSIRPGMMTSIPGAGAKYLESAKDADGDFLSGERACTLTLSPGIPANLFCLVTAYDATTAVGLDNGQPFPSFLLTR